MECCALIPYQVTALKLFQLNGSNPHMVTVGTEADIHACANLAGTSGCTFITNWHSTHTQISVLVFAKDQLRMSVI